MMEVPSQLKLVVFDLDETLHFHSLLYLPYHVRYILQFFRKHNVPIALASMNTSAIYYLRLYKIIRYFSAVEARKPPSQVSSWTEHQENVYLTKKYMFKRLMTKFHCAPNEILFFDDMNGNVEVARSMGLHAVKVDGDLCIRWKDIFEGIQQFRSVPKHRKSAEF